MRDLALTFLSKLVNVLTGGDWSLFCARAYRRGWRITRLIDRQFGANHCAAMHVWQERHRRPR